jgi:hypothetical protein
MSAILYNIQNVDDNISRFKKQKIFLMTLWSRILPFTALSRPLLSLCYRGALKGSCEWVALLYVFGRDRRNLDGIDSINSEP